MGEGRETWRPGAGNGGGGEAAGERKVELEMREADGFAAAGEGAGLLRSRTGVP